jgi:hypothetical protein
MKIENDSDVEYIELTGCKVLTKFKTEALHTIKEA